MQRWEAIDLIMYNILLVDDNPADVRLVIEALKVGQLSCHITTIENGEKALAWLRVQAKERGAPPPDLILLDLNLPQMSGHTVLALPKADPLLQRIPVLILTTSHFKEDERQAYQLGAAQFLIKPDTWAGYVRMVDVIGSLCAGERP